MPELRRRRRRVHQDRPEPRQRLPRRLTIERIATAEHTTWTAIYAAIARHRRRIANTTEGTTTHG